MTHFKLDQQMADHVPNAQPSQELKVTILTAPQITVELTKSPDLTEPALLALQEPDQTQPTEIAS